MNKYSIWAQFSTILARAISQLRRATSQTLETVEDLSRGHPTSAFQRLLHGFYPPQNLIKVATPILYASDVAIVAKW